MTKRLTGKEIADHINKAFPETAIRYNQTDVWITPDSLFEVAKFLKKNSELDFKFLTAITAVDYIEYFEIIYHLLSMRRNRSAILKIQCFGRENPTVASVVDVWQGAELQEREIWDLMGINFDGHPNMKRILLWEGYPGHPLRKDSLN